MNLVLKRCILAADDKIGIVGEYTHELFDPDALALGEVAQHIVLHHILGTGMANADADAPIVVADVLGDRA